MVDKRDIELINLTKQDIAECLENPDTRFKTNSTGQLKSIGGEVLRRIVDLSENDYNAQLDSAIEHGVECICEDMEQRLIGISTTVSLIYDNDVIDKQVVVPAGQLHKERGLSQHLILAVYVVGEKNEEGNIVNVQNVYVGGWLPASKLVRFVKKGGAGAFQVNRMSLAIAPMTVLLPLTKLQRIVRWHQLCV